MEEETSLESSESEETDPRPLEELKSILKSDRCDLMNNLEIVELINAGESPQRSITWCLFA